jgi:hypothetical protein
MIEYVGSNVLYRSQRQTLLFNYDLSDIQEGKQISSGFVFNVQAQSTKKISVYVEYTQLHCNIMVDHIVGLDFDITDFLANYSFVTKADVNLAPVYFDKYKSSVGYPATPKFIQNTDGSRDTYFMPMDDLTSVGNLLTFRSLPVVHEVPCQ